MFIDLKLSFILLFFILFNQVNLYAEENTGVKDLGQALQKLYDDDINFFQEEAYWIFSVQNSEDLLDQLKKLEKIDEYKKVSTIYLNYFFPDARKNRKSCLEEWDIEEGVHFEQVLFNKILGFGIFHYEDSIISQYSIYKNPSKNRFVVIIKYFGRSEFYYNFIKYENKLCLISYTPGI